MPLVSVNKGAATVICAICGHERTVALKDWRKVLDEDKRPVDSAFMTSACPQCAASGRDTVESFFMHDDVAVTVREHPAEFVHVDDDGTEHVRVDVVKVIEADPASFDAQHQALVGELGKQLGCTPAKWNRPRNGIMLQYPSPPRAPDPNDVRNDVAVQMMKRGAKVLPDFLP